ncbi:AbrB/MazE/SpoVT family DNA-binding domain-containing protein [Thermoactinomyces daqus]|uniref:AbrB/MazE/SpoVT family DNA-binding domain-containing protein n=1 Tax=Thermoactinomyces daqus TaxID=1329516 RepID=A0A7W1XD54_9BACL|nr:AbrB/MazE/SpoVT family DNA-binding domain-containing protein [Thermoactinomyces daqus]MBA4544472.1 AbrB/MazE/SpoVT family DNA-binding domain-containing protein [Thermoactinomyces daqus]
MAIMEFARLTSKGQVTIPKNIRKELGLETGDRLAFGKNERGEIVLRKANLDTFDRLQNLIQLAAEQEGITEEQLLEDLRKLREERRNANR